MYINREKERMNIQLKNFKWHTTYSSSSKSTLIERTIATANVNSDRLQSDELIRSNSNLMRNLIEKCERDLWHTHTHWPRERIINRTGLFIWTNLKNNSRWREAENMFIYQSFERCITRKKPDSSMQTERSDALCDIWWVSNQQSGENEQMAELWLTFFFVAVDSILMELCFTSVRSIDRSLKASNNEG